MNIRKLIGLYLLNILSYTFSHLVEESENPTDIREETKNVFLFVDGNMIPSTLINGNHVPIISIHLKFQNTSYIIDLTLNTHLMASNYKERIITENGTIYRYFNHSEEMCYYGGKIQNYPNSKAAFSTCEGIRGFFVLDNFTFHVRPLQIWSPDQLQLYEIRRAVKDNLSNWICGVQDLKRRFNGIANFRVKRQINPDSMDGQKIVELYVANDVRRLNYFNGDFSKLSASTKEIVNTANLLYQPVGFFVVMVGMEHWTIDQIYVSTNSTITLKNLEQYRTKSIVDQYYNDVGFLMSYQTFESNILGLANVGTMCSSRLSAGIMTAIKENSAVSGAILAHEIGHVFGLTHDSNSCVCESPDVTCIMKATASTEKPSLYFSSCSKNELKISVEKGFDICLKDFPTVQYNYYQVCGNGILEQGEECDCGRRQSQECNSGCCNATTCKLIGQAKCASGKCCDVNTCQLRQAGFRCRPTIGPCDITEVCNGTSAYCPKNVYKHDGIACSANGVNTYCWGGMCRSQRSQCNELYGPSVLESNSLCYQVINIRGDQYGYCSFKNDIYSACQSGDAMCGSIKCDVEYGNLTRYTKFILKTSGSVGTYKCEGIILDYGNRVENPGMVPNGASCGVGKMCVSQKCESVENKLKENPCPLCNDMVCTNEGKCICDPDSTCIGSAAQTSTILTATTKSVAETISRQGTTISAILGSTAALTSATKMPPIPGPTSTSKLIWETPSFTTVTNLGIVTNIPLTTPAIMPPTLGLTLTTPTLVTTKKPQMPTGETPSFTLGTKLGITNNIPITTPAIMPSTPGLTLILPISTAARTPQIPTGPTRSIVEAPSFTTSTKLGIATIVPLTTPAGIHPTTVVETPSFTTSTKLGIATIVPLTTPAGIHPTTASTTPKTPQTPTNGLGPFASTSRVAVTPSITGLLPAATASTTRPSNAGIFSTKWAQSVVSGTTSTLLGSTNLVLGLLIFFLI